MKKVLDILKVALAAIVKFLAFPYASEITIGAFGVIELLAKHTFIAILIFAWGVLLARNEFIENKTK